MKVSIQIKFLVVCIFLVLLTTICISITYYILAKQDKHRASQERIRIGFDIILDDFESQIQFHTRKFDGFLQDDPILIEATNTYNHENEQLRVPSFVVTYLARVAGSIRELGYDVAAHQVALYGIDKRLLAVYQRDDDYDVTGVYVTSETNSPTFLLLGDSSQPVMLGESSQTISSILFSKRIPDHPLPADIDASYAGDIPDNISINPFRRGQKFGIQIIAPVLKEDDKIGVLIGEVFYTQSDVERYASLSQTAVNVFGEHRLSIGTLADQTLLDQNVLEQSVLCQDIMTENIDIPVTPLTLDESDYYQGSCVFRDDRGVVGAIAVSLSQEVEKQAIRKTLTTILTIAVIAIGVGVGLSWGFSRATLRSIHNIVSVIGLAAEGDLRKSATAITRDEIGMLAEKLNRMISQLRSISGQVQGAASTVNTTADTIFQQMDALVQHMEQQTVSVDNTTSSVEKINLFIDAVARNTNDLLTASSQIFSSIQEIRASTHEVMTTTGVLTSNLHLISSSVDEVNHSVKEISGHTGHLEEVAQQTEIEVHHIDQSLREVSQNADRSQQLAKETMNAASSGQISVDSSLQGMTDIRDVVSQIAQIIQEVNSWGLQVSSILDIVDEITEQTSLLALNASIISAQAGEHGRGFSVVANEIKDLAIRTKTSTQKISTLIRELQTKTGEGVEKTVEGIKKAEQGMLLTHAVKDALGTILDSATRSSATAADTAQVIQQTVTSSEAINTSINQVTDMVSHIMAAIQAQEHDIEQVGVAVDNISGMSEQVNRANVEQTKTAEQIMESMEHITEQFNDISEQTEELKHNSYQIVTAMHTIESTTDTILRNATSMSHDTLKDLLQQSDVLQKIVSVFKVS